MLHRQEIGLRPPEEIMELTRLGAVWPTKFSFSHSFLRTMCRVGFSCRIEGKTLDDEGRGRIVYRASVAGETLTFVVFSDPLAESEQQDRIIATRWDFWAALFVGEPSAADLEQSRIEIQKVVWGRAAPHTITWSRANRSARLFEHVVDCLAAGHQPDPRLINQIGYLIRTTGFSGNGRNGMHDFAYLRDIGHPLQAPYHAQMLAAYLWRDFGFDLAMHLAQIRNPGAVDLSDDIRRFVGVGNSSGIGLAPFVVRHPRLIHTWIEVRERALAEMRNAGFGADDPRCAQMSRLIEDAVVYFRQEPTGDLDEFTPGEVIAAELERAGETLSRLLAAPDLDAGYPNPLAALTDHIRSQAGAETQELLNSLLLEIHDDGRVDAQLLHADETLGFPPDMVVGELLETIVERFRWLPRFAAANGRNYFWYASEENMEPRRGWRGIDEGEEYALPMDILGRLEVLIDHLRAAPPDQPLTRFLVDLPDMYYMVGWAFTLAGADYAIARMDLLGEDFSPLRIMRFQLATYGMLKFRPRSRTWLRATLFQGAGLPGELAAGKPGDGLLPRIPTSDFPTEVPTIVE